jgi:hypothetical protein
LLAFSFQNTSSFALKLVLTCDAPFAEIPRMMKTRIAVVALGLSLAGVAACFAADAHIGTWKTDEAKSKFAPGMGKTSTVQYAQKKDQLEVTVDGLDKDGKPSHGVWKGKTDGKGYKVKGNLTWDMMAYKMVDDHTYEITAMKDGKTTWTAKSTVAKDGKSRTLNMNGTDADGKKFKAKIVYDKQG